MPTYTTNTKATFFFKSLFPSINNCFLENCCSIVLNYEVVINKIVFASKIIFLEKTEENKGMYRRKYISKITRILGHINRSILLLISISPHQIMKREWNIVLKVITGFPGYSSFSLFLHFDKWKMESLFIRFCYFFFFRLVQKGKVFFKNTRKWEMSHILHFLILFTLQIMHDVIARV